jgi:hypothetical protein
VIFTGLKTALGYLPNNITLNEGIAVKVVADIAPMAMILKPIHSKF